MVAPVTPSVMVVPEAETIEPIDPPLTPPRVKSPNAALLSVTAWSVVIAICVVETVAALEKTGEFASIPGAVPDAIVVISVPGFPAASFRVMLTGSAAASRMSSLPSTTV